jgi:hypothetical protein
MHTGGRGGRGGTSYTPYKDFWKLPHKNAINTTPPLIFSQPQVPPSKEFAQKTQPQGLPPPGFPTTVHLCLPKPIDVFISLCVTNVCFLFVFFRLFQDLFFPNETKSRFKGSLTLNLFRSSSDRKPVSNVEA